MGNYVVLSLETHLFFARIMREHALFLEAGFPCKDEAWIKKADGFRLQFENLLRETVRIAGGRVERDILESGEVVTEFTIPAERRTMCLTGIPIDSGISMAEQRLCGGCGCEENREVCQKVQRINKRALELLNGLIAFKESILREVDCGALFTGNYPLLIKHIIREAKLYRDIVEGLLCGRCVSRRSMRETEEFWNQIMMEHALFIRGLLDPSEEKLIDTADGFAQQYRKLLDQAKCRNRMACDEQTKRTIVETQKYREFKAAGAGGILNCEIESIILPLLADHVLREANHYLRILECECGGCETRN